jgi:hypothetical protein
MRQGVLSFDGMGIVEATRRGPHVSAHHARGAVREHGEQLAPLRALGSGHHGDHEAFRATVGTSVVRAVALLAEAEKHLIQVSPIGAAVLDTITVQKSLLEEACSLASRDSPNDSALPRAMARLAARPFGESTQQLLDAVPLWARGEQKRVQLTLVGREALVPLRLEPGSWWCADAPRAKRGGPRHRASCAARAGRQGV